MGFERSVERLGIGNSKISLFLLRELDLKEIDAATEALFLQGRTSFFNADIVILRKAKVVIQMNWLSHKVWSL